MTRSMAFSLASVVIAEINCTYWTENAIQNPQRHQAISEQDQELYLEKPYKTPRSEQVTERTRPRRQAIQPIALL